VCLTLHKELTAVARGLRQLVAFTRDPASRDAIPLGAAAGLADAAATAAAAAAATTAAVRRAALCDGLSACKGALAALLDARQVSWEGG
jgi:hypothetical protein